LNGLETAIRNALARAPGADAEQRARVYQSARSAVEKSLQKQGAADTETLESQRARVEAVIASIEAEYSGPAFAAEAAGSRVAVDPVAPDSAAATGITDPSIGPELETRRDTAPPVDPSRDPVRQVRRDEDASPVIEAGDRLGVAPHRAEAAAVPSIGREERSKSGFRRREKKARQAEKKPRRRSGSFRSFLIQLAVLVALIGAGLWWISANGGVEQIGRRLADSSAELLGGGPDNSVFQPAQRVGAGQFSGDWISILSPENFDTVEGSDGVIVERVEDSEAEALRITSVGVGEAGEVRIPLGQEARAAMQGGRSVVALTVSTSGDEATQISVRCIFAGAEDCARQRFEVFFERNDIIFDVNLAGGPTGEDAALLINSDISGEGRSIDLFAVRVQPAPR
jgi:hypothetical protein